MRKQKIETVLFDWDGCLADTLSLWLDAYQKVFAEYGVNVAESEIVQKAFGNWEAANLFGIEDGDGFSKKLVQYVTEGIKTVRLNGNIKKILKRFKKKGVKVAIVSSSVRSLITPALKFNKIEDLIDEIVDGEDVDNHKPDPEPVRLALDRLESSPEKTLMVGDSQKDVLAGKRAGVFTAVYYPTINQMFYKRREIDQWEPDYVVLESAEFLELV